MWDPDTSTEQSGPGLWVGKSYFWGSQAVAQRMHVRERGRAGSSTFLVTHRGAQRPGRLAAVQGETDKGTSEPQTSASLCRQAPESLHATKRGSNSAAGQPLLSPPGLHSHVQIPGKSYLSQS